MKDLLLLATKLIGKTPYPCNPKEQYPSFIRNKTTKLLKLSEIITYHSKTFEKQNTDGIKSVIAEHPKSSYKLSKIKK